MKWNRDDFYKFIISQNVVGFFKEPLILKSGRHSYWYVNWRNVAEDVHSIDVLSNFIIAFIKNLGLKPDCFYGVPEGATKLGIICQFKWAKEQPDYNTRSYILSMGRAKPKEHGDPKDKFFLGKPRGKIIILEDVTTTGGSLIETIDKLNQIDVSIIAAISLTNRNELREDKKSVEIAVREKGVPYHAMSNAIDLIPYLNPDKTIISKIEAYFKKYGTNEFKMSKV
ncbi:MAG: orotate phosphoribosyltransferase [Candidatus Hodarchaeota archaeon]